MEDVYNMYFLLLNSSSEDKICYKTYIVNSSTQVTLKESTNMISDGTTGLRTWEAAFYLGEWCIANTEKLVNRYVLELGSGSGLTGLTVCLACHPASFCFSDFHPKVLSQLQANIDINKLCSGKGTVERLNPDGLGSTTKIKVINLDWADESDKAEEPCDVILAADVVYDVSIIPALVNVLHKYLSTRLERVAVIALTVRNEDTVRVFLSALDGQNISRKAEVGEVPHIFQYSRTNPVQIWKLTAANNR